LRVFHELSKRSGIHGDPHPNRRSTWDKARLVGPHLTDSVSRNPFLARGPYDALVVPHPRKPGGVEVYTERLRSELGARALVIDSGINGTPLPGSRNLDVFVSVAGSVRLGHVRDPMIETVTRDLEAATGVTVPIAALIDRALPKHLRLRRLYRALLKKQTITTVYVVVAYFHQHIVAAARDLGIKVVELQHGAISPYHLGYSYPGRPVVPGQPDELWCLGRYWAETVEFPAGMTTKVTGAPFIRRLTDAEAARKDPRLVVVASQGTIGPRLWDVARETAQLRRDLEFVFRLHPSERLADYRGTVPPPNLRLSAGSEESTLELLASAGQQVGVSTTALFEGMVLGCRTAVAALPGWEYLEPVVTRGDALVVRDATELAARVTSAPICHDSSAYYAPPV
jgi:hypothetical protein